MKLLDIIRETTLEIGEQAALVKLFKGFTKNLTKLTIRDLRALHPTFADDITKVFTARTIKGVTTLDDLVVQLSKGTLSSTGYGDLITGLLKTKGVSDDYIKLVAKDWVEDSRFIANYVTRGDKLTKNTLLKKGYSATAADEIIKAANGSKKFQDALKGVGGKVKPNPSPGRDSWFSKWFGGGKTKPKVTVNTTRVGEWLGKRWKNFSTARKIIYITSLMAIGYVGYTVYDYIQALLGIDPLPDLDNQDAPPSVKDWKKCVVDEFEGRDGSIADVDDNGVYLQVSINEFAGKQTGGWIRFYSDYKVTTKSGETGKWDCASVGTINEQDDTVAEMDNDVENMIDLLDFPVSGSDLQSANDLLKKYLNNGKGQQFLSLYQRSGLGGGDLRKSLGFVVTTKASSTRLKDEMLSMITKIQSGGQVDDTEGDKSDKENEDSSNTSKLTVIWDDGKTSDDSNRGIKYSPCNDFPMSLGCISDKIKDIQRCLNPDAYLKVDGYFGPLTMKSLQKKLNSSDDVTITKEIYDGIMKDCKKESSSTDTTSSTDTVTREPIDVKPKGVELIPLTTLNTDEMRKKFGEDLLKQANKTIDGERVIEIIREKVRFTVGGRYILNMDGELTEGQLKSINQWMAGLGYYLDKKKETLDKARYVWVAKDRDSRRIARKQNQIDKIRTNNEE